MLIELDALKLRPKPDILMYVLNGEAGVHQSILIFAIKVLPSKA
jgi:hypothetical protein